MRRLQRWFALWLLGWIGLNFVEVRRYWQIFLWMPKMLAGGMAPLLGVVSGVNGLLGLCRGDIITTAAGALGAALATRYTRQVTAPHDAFAVAFGPNWQDGITAGQRARMLQQRYVGILPQAPEPRWERDVVFWTLSEAGPGGDARPLLCDLWQPPDHIAPSGLAVIYLHGSGWHWLDKDAGTRSFFCHLAAQGHVIMDVAYRLAPEADMHGMVGDSKRAVAWLKANAAQYGVDPARIVLCGGSAGGHLALLAAYTPDHAELDPADLGGADTSVCGVISFYGPADVGMFYDALRAIEPDRASPVERRLDAISRQLFRFTFGDGEAFPLHELTDMIAHPVGGSPEDVPEHYALYSPLTHVGQHCPPTLLLQGAHDIGVRPEIARALREALDAAGVPVVYVEFPWTDHAFDLMIPPLAPAAHAAYHDVEWFLALLAQ